MWKSTILFHFPQAMLLLAWLVPWWIGQVLLNRYRQRQQHLYSPHLAALLVPRSPLLTRAKVVGWTLVWTFLCLALMGPFSQRENSSTLPSESVFKAAPLEVMFLIDTSASMRVPDGPEGETRLEAAKAIVADVIHQMPGQLSALYAFTSELTPVVPPTLDSLFLQLALKDLHIDQGDVGGTRFVPVLKGLHQQILSQHTNKYYAVIVLSDGGDTPLELAKTSEEQTKALKAIQVAFPDPDKLHLHLSTVGVGTSQAQVIPHVTDNGRRVLSKLEPLALQQMAVQGKGRYYEASQWTSWSLAEKLVKQIEQTAKADTVQEANNRAAALKGWHEDLYYQIPLGIALILYAFNLLLPDTRRT